MVSGDRWWCLEWKFLTFGHRHFWKFEESCKPLPRKMHTAHPPTRFLSISGNSQNSWNTCVNPKLKILNTLEASLWKASFYLSALSLTSSSISPEGRALKRRQQEMAHRHVLWPGHGIETNWEEEDCLSEMEGISIGFFIG